MGGAVAERFAEEGAASRGRWGHPDAAHYTITSVTSAILYTTYLLSGVTGV
jgi:hypothetical protein